MTVTQENPARPGRPSSPAPGRPRKLAEKSPSFVEASGTRDREQPAPKAGQKFPRAPGPRNSPEEVLAQPRRLAKNSWPRAQVRAVPAAAGRPCNLSQETAKERDRPPPPTRSTRSRCADAPAEQPRRGPRRGRSGAAGPGPNRRPRGQELAAAGPARQRRPRTDALACKNSPRQVRRGRARPRTDAPRGQEPRRGRRSDQAAPRARVRMDPTAAGQARSGRQRSQPSGRWSSAEWKKRSQ